MGRSIGVGLYPVSAGTKGEINASMAHGVGKEVTFMRTEDKLPLATGR